MSILGKQQIICSIFKKISSTKPGAILNVNKADVIIAKSCFYEIYSQNFPGCFLINESKFNVKSCYFFSCYTSGGDAKFGKVCFAKYSFVTIKHFSAVKCGPSVSRFGDSINVFDNSRIDAVLYNTSCCYGISGCSTLSIWNPIENVEIKYINCVDCIDWCSYETFYNDYIENIIDTNIINSSGNSNYCFNLINARKTCSFINCTFISSCSNFCYGPAHMSLINCISDEKRSGASFAVINAQATFKQYIKIPKSCTQHIKRNRILLFNCPHLMFMIFISA